MNDKDRAKVIIDIAELPCGEPDSQWIDFVSINPQDAWQIAFSAGLMAAISRLEQDDER